jgi:transcriptional regulator with XRE-family HTH domain
MDPKLIVGNFIKEARTKRKASQQELSEKAGITYQYLSEIETGKANLTIDVLSAVSGALGLNLPKLVSLAFMVAESATVPKVKPQFLRTVPLPGSLTVADVELVLNETQRLVGVVNYNLVNLGIGPLNKLIQGNNFSGMVSNLLSESFHNLTSFKNNSHQRYPDLIDAKTEVGLEVKTTIKVGKGGESHNGHSGWHLIACYEILESGNIEFVHVMLADLVGHTHKETTDWKYMKSQVNEETGSQRTETYSTNAQGVAKLRDGSVYLNADKISFKRWRTARAPGASIPEWSIYAPTKTLL